MNKADTDKARLSHHRRVRGKVTGITERPRLNVFRLAKNIYARIIDDVAGVTLVAASTLDREFTDNGKDKEAAKQVGELIAKYTAKEGITEVMPNCGGYIFHGRVKELTEGACEGGLKF